MPEKTVSLSAHREQWVLHVRDALHAAVAAAVRRCVAMEGGGGVPEGALTRALTRELDPWLEQMVGVTTIPVGAPPPAEETRGPPPAASSSPSLLSRQAIDAMGHVERGRLLKARGLKVPRKAEERRQALIALLPVSGAPESKVGEKRRREEEEEGGGEAERAGRPSVPKRRLTVKDMLAQMKVPVTATVALVREGGVTIDPDTRCIVERVKEGTTVVKGRLHEDGVTTLPLSDADTAWAERHNFIVMDVDQSKARHQPLVYTRRDVAVHETVAEDEVLVLEEDGTPPPPDTRPTSVSPSLLRAMESQTLEEPTRAVPSLPLDPPQRNPGEDDDGVVLPPPPSAPPQWACPRGAPLPRWDGDADTTSTIHLPPPG